MVRGPGGFVCQYCGLHDEPSRFPNRSSVVLRCRSCKRDTSLTADTVMQRTHMPISIWFWAAYLVSSQTPGMSAVQFQRQLGLKRYETAFQILHKLRVAMVRPDRDRIGGGFPVEVDETWVGGRTRGEGRGRHHKTLVVGVIEERKRKVNEGQRDPAGHCRVVVASTPGACVCASRLTARRSRWKASCLTRCSRVRTSRRTTGQATTTSRIRATGSHRLRNAAIPTSRRSTCRSSTSSSAT